MSGPTDLPISSDRPATYNDIAATAPERGRYGGTAIPTEFTWEAILASPLTLALVAFLIVWLRLETTKIGTQLAKLQERNDKKDGTNGYGKPTPPTDPPKEGTPDGHSDPE